MVLSQSTRKQTTCVIPLPPVEGAGAMSSCVDTGNAMTIITKLHANKVRVRPAPMIPMMLRCIGILDGQCVLQFTAGLRTWGLLTVAPSSPSVMMTADDDADGDND